MRETTNRSSGRRLRQGTAAAALVTAVLLLGAVSVGAAPGDLAQTPRVALEAPVPAAPELAPAASLKQAPLWKELVQLLEDPYGAVERRPGFGAVMPALETWALDYNPLTRQPLRLRTSDDEISWDQPSKLSDPDEVVTVDADNNPTQLRTMIGELVAEDYSVNIGGVDHLVPDGALVVRNPELGDAGPPDARIPPDGTIVAVPAVIDGQLYGYDPATGARTLLTALDVPVNENDFLRDQADATGLGGGLENLPATSRGRAAAEALGKALFWDMQVGSDGVQACASCHFHAGADNRTRGQINPGTLGGDSTQQVRGPNQELEQADFPFHDLVDPIEVGEPLWNAANVAADSNDVVSSMGVRLRRFMDIPTPGPEAFGPPVNGVSPLLPDIGAEIEEPIGAFTGLRRVEPRNTPTIIGAAFNFDNFWDGRARSAFNGGSVHGPSDPQAHVIYRTGAGLVGATNGHVRPDILQSHPDEAGQPVRVMFSSLASQALGPPLSDFEMSFQGRNWQKLGKKLLQSGVVPLANQLVDPEDSVLGPYSNQRSTVGGPVDQPGRPGLNISYRDLVALAFVEQYWNSAGQHLQGAPDASDPVDGYSLTVAQGDPDPADTDQFTQMEANFSLFFGLGVQAYEELLIPDDTPFDRFMDANPLAANGLGNPGFLDDNPGLDAATFPTLIRDLVGGGLTLIPDDPSTPEYDGFGPEEIYGFDIFAGGDLTAALPTGDPYNPAGYGSNPLARSARCGVCHLGPELSDHGINFTQGFSANEAPVLFPSPPTVLDPAGNIVPNPQPPGPVMLLQGLMLAAKANGDTEPVEIDVRNFATVDDPATPWNDAIVGQPGHFSFGEEGMYNVGLRPLGEDAGRGGSDPFGWPLSRAALALQNVGGAGFSPPDTPSDPPSLMADYDPADPGSAFAPVGGQATFPGTSYTLQSINPGFERTPRTPQLPAHLAPWVNGLPEGVLHPQLGELFSAPNTIVPAGGGNEFAAVIFGALLHSSTYNPAVYGAGPPNHGWGAVDPLTALPVLGKSPNNQSGVSGNFDVPLQGTTGVANRVHRQGGFKTAGLRNVGLTGPYLHTGSYLTLRQVVDFYMRGGDFPVTNKEFRDQHLVDVELNAFGFGRTKDVNGDLAPFEQFLPPGRARYWEMPDTTFELAPEPATSTPEAAKQALVKFLLSLTDPRVRYQRAPFDHPELFVPVDARAGDNTGGRAALAADPMFRQVPELGAAGSTEPLEGFLGVADEPVAGDNNDHFDTGSSIVGPPADTAAPFVLGLHSTSHPDPALVYVDDDPAFSWVAEDPSGIAGYSYVLDQTAGTVPDTTAEGAQPSARLVNVAPGTWHFHVRALDGAGNWGEASHVTVQLVTPTDPQPAVTAPDAGGSFGLGEVVPVSWTLSNPANGLLHAYAYAADGTYHWLSTQVASPAVTDYGFDWTVGQPVGTGYLLRVWFVDEAGNWLSFDDSALPFEITAGTLPRPQVTAPDAGGSFGQGAVVPVSWTLLNPAAGLLHAYALSADGSYHWLATRAASPAQTDYGFSWTVTEPLGTGYLLRVWFVDEAGNWLSFDDSAQTFAITAGTLPQPAVTAPDSGGSFGLGEVVPVSWTLSNPANGLLHAYAYAADGTYHWLSTQVASPAVTDYGFDWTVAQPVGTGYLLRVWFVDEAGNWLSFDDSAQAFVITLPQPKPLVTAPDAGGSFGQGEIVPVSWTLANPAGGLLHAYAVAADSTHHWLATQVASAGQSVYGFDWTVTQPVGTGYLLRVWFVDEAGNWLHFDDSSQVFEITAGSRPKPQVTSPDSGGSFGRGSSVPVSWTLSNPAPGLMHAYAVAADSTHYWLGTRTAFAGQTSYGFNWTVDQPVGSGYRVRVWFVDEAGNWVSFDDSDVTFQIN